MILTEGQRSRIEENKKKALEIRRSRENAQNASQPNANTSELININKHEELRCDQLAKENQRCDNILTTNDMIFYENFNEKCCMSCRQLNPADYDLISRTELISEYLIPLDSIKLMKCMTKPNPHNSYWTPMKLYLRKHARLKAFDRFGGVEGLEEEVKRRKNLKFEKEFAQTKDLLHQLTGSSLSISSSSIVSVDPKSSSQQQVCDYSLEKSKYSYPIDEIDNSGKNTGFRKRSDFGKDDDDRNNNNSDDNSDNIDDNDEDNDDEGGGGFLTNDDITHRNPSPNRHDLTCMSSSSAAQMDTLSSSSATAIASAMSGASAATAIKVAKASNNTKAKQGKHKFQKLAVDLLAMRKK